MCGRIVQKSGPMDYVERIFSSMTHIFVDPAGPRYNVPPGTRPLAMHRLAEGAEAITRLPWGYKRTDSKHFMSNAKLETILKNGWPWRFLIGTGRILVPADGWYEWAKQDDGTKQPYYIHGDGPLYFAALTAWEPGAELDAAHGFAIVTNDAKGGMVDVHDRRPVALPPDVAKLWVDPAYPTADARALLSEGLPETAFTWHPVRQDVGNSKYQLPDAIDPV
ncbi:SOS response-associated peptidase [Achromobacter sp.]|uniref:SOS response-associated peptidase n=1 Tax=Achromobacter sp. TaxID=134375 RepID=UPI002F9560BA